ncbi:MAG: zinc ribbon domain-containing protein [Candidatus Goldiibacteriota bacterium]
MNEGEILKQLWEIQKIDSKILGLQKEKESIADTIGEKEDIINVMKNEFEDKKNKLTETRKRKKEVDTDIKTKEDEITKKDAQSSQITTNEAYKALQDEMERMRHDIKKLEEKAIVFMEEEEEFFSWIKEQEKTMKFQEQEIQGLIKELQAESEKKDAEINKLLEERTGLIPGVDKSWYDRYEMIRKNKRDVAVARLKVEKNGEGVCTGCKMAVRAQAVIEVRKNKKIWTCDSCARIWYVEEDAAAE